VKFHHYKLPDYSTLLSGRIPREELSFQSEKLQIWYNNSESHWADPNLHLHQESDECFIVLRGKLVVEVEGQQYIIGPREFCCFPAGVYHAVVGTHPPIETFMIRTPSVDDKVYKPFGE
jgi:mannose-6-phosphate isomerase-like protein (cupin superfamily)